MALGQLLGRRGMRGARRRPNPLAPQAPHFAAEGEAGHLPVHGRRRRATWSCSTTSRSSPSSTARCRRPNCSRAIARRSSTRTRSCSGRSSSSPSTASAGAELSELLPHLAEVVDDVAIVKSMATDAFNHAPGQILMSTGSQQFGRPSLGAWTLLRPGQRVARPARLRRLQHRQEGAQRRQLELGQRLPADGLPGRPVPHRRRPGAVPLEPRGRRRRAPARLARRHRHARTQIRLDAMGDPEIATRINSFEMAFRMQTSRPRGDGPLAASRSTSWTCTAPSRASRRSPTPACWPAGWSSAACGSCRSSTRPGTSTATSSTT